MYGFQDLLVRGSFVYADRVVDQSFLWTQLARYQPSGHGIGTLSLSYSCCGA
jgi:hypothetical protein